MKNHPQTKLRILRQELQGHLIITLRNSPTNQPIDENEVRRKFQQFGEVKSVRPCGDRPEYVLFFLAFPADTQSDATPAKPTSSSSIHGYVL